MRVLLTNDDGFNADGIKILRKVVQRFATEIWIVAPSADKSGAARSMHLRAPIKINHVGKTEFTIDGTPAECVFLALHKIMGDKKPDLILSGINHGSNVGNDITYSGTIGAAMEGATLGIPSIALSQAYNKGFPIDWTNSELYTERIVRQLLANVTWGKNTLININFPHTGEVKEIKFIKQGRNEEKVDLDYIKNKDGVIESCIIYGTRSSKGELFPDGGSGSVEAVNDGCIAITPLNTDLTDYKMLEMISAKVIDFSLPGN